MAAPVVSIGNLTVGGSGKTPLAGEIARMLIGMGERPAILSRGYARSQPSEGVVVVSDGRVIKTDVAHSGDEPMMLARAVPGAAVVVCPDRYVAGRVAEAQLGCTVHLLDDGFQHFQLARDIDLLVAQPEDFADSRTLPFGRFREPLDAAAAADALFVPVGGAVTPAEMAERLKVSLAFGFERRIDAPRAHTPVFAFAGIAKPQHFFGELTRAGWQLTGGRSFPDHHQYSQREIDDLGKEARSSGAELIVTTSKDAVRLSALVAVGLPIQGVPLRISIASPFEPWLRERLLKARAA